MACECPDPMCGVICDSPEPGALRLSGEAKFWEFIKLALSEIADPDSRWPGSEKLAASTCIERIREAQSADWYRAGA